MKPLGADMARSLEATTVRCAEHLDDAMAYLETRGIDRVTAKRHRLGMVAEAIPGQSDVVGRLSIPFISAGGVVYMQFRCMQPHDCKAVSCPKYLSWAGSESRLFNSRAVVEAGDLINVTEGPLDAVTLSACGLPAVGVPGVQAWGPHLARVLAGFSRVLVWTDGDKPGRDFGKRVLADVERAVVVPMPEGQDVNGMFVSVGRDGLLALADSEKS